MSAVGAVSTSAVIVSAIVMFGIYMIKRIETGLVKARQETKEALVNNQQLRDEVRSLKVELNLAQRKIHDADA